MSVYSNRYQWNWRPVAGDIRRVTQLCPRCRNSVEYFLAYDGEGYGLPGLLTFNLKQHYAFKCPICPNFEYLANEEARSIIRRAK